MSFSFSDEQVEFRGMLRRFLDARSTSAAVREQMATVRGFDDAVWRQLCDQLGVAGIHLPEDVGGQGFGAVELGIVMEEMGHALLCAPYLSSCVLASGAVRHIADAAEQRELLPDLASGARRATLCWAESGTGFDPTGIRLTVRGSGADVSLDGEKTFVLDGASAEQLLVVGRAEGDPQGPLRLVLVNPDAPGVTRKPLEALDATRKLARIRFDGVGARALGGDADALSGLEATLHEATVALANESVGGAQRLLSSAVDYAKTRVQFGRPIGGFQAIKHGLAELLLDVELARSAAYRAAGALADDEPDALALASLAKAATSENFMRAAVECIQVHGGIGFTWDNDTQLWYRRAKSSEVFLGTPDEHRERLMTLWAPAEEAQAVEVQAMEAQP